MYVQAISKFAPHPNAAKLWMEHLYSDEGQLIWLKGYCNPIRYEDWSRAGSSRRTWRPSCPIRLVPSCRRRPSSKTRPRTHHQPGGTTTVGVTVQ